MQELDPAADEYVPNAQDMQETAYPETTFVCCPAAQAVQFPDANVLYWPELQLAQDVSKLVTEFAKLYVPAATQVVQAVDARAVGTVPVGQLMHELDPVEEA